MKSESKYNQINGSVALKAGVWYVISSIMVKMVAVITTPIFTRMLSTDEYGTVATFSSWHALFYVIFSLNLIQSIGRAKLDYKDKLDDYIGSMQLLSLIVSLGLSTIICIFIVPISEFFELSKFATALLMLYLIAAPSIQFYQSGYRYKYQYKQNVAIAWYTTLSTVILSLALIWTIDGNRAELRMIGIVIPTVVLSVFFWIKSIRNGHLKLNTEYWRYGLMISLPMILHSISLNVLAQSDRVVILKICGATPVAYYSLVRNYALLLLVVTDAINQAWQPWFHDNYNEGNTESIRKNTKLLVVFTCYFGLACTAIGPEAIYILGGEQYAKAAGCLPPMVLGVVCQCIYTHYINIELHWKKTKYASQGTVIAAVLNIVLNFIFVPMFGYVAAAYTTFASYCVLMALHCYITRKKIGVHLYYDGFMFKAMGITAVIALIVSLTYSNMIMRFGLMFIGFMSFLWVFRNNISEYLEKLKTRKK